ncbi:conserved hypothetical protein [Treponema primitia ZAS-2]|uniref:Uncharacterized protein n=2 Tax=Treponema primitia TaxID=88058 RepID=F5YGU0_TREPZ|nr:conserved hypothetical protein [Treponema primitia ZAS-2]
MLTACGDDGDPTTPPSSWTPPPELPAISGTVNIAGTPEVGYTLYADVTDIDGAEDDFAIVIYQWIRGTSPIIGENEEYFDLTDDDKGNTISLQVSLYGYAGTISSSPTVPIIGTDGPGLSGTVSIAGTLAVGGTLTADITSLGGSGTISYQWLRDKTNIGTNAATYTLVDADVGQTINVRVSREDNSSFIYSNYLTISIPDDIGSALSGTVTIDGIPAIGETLTANTDSLGGSGAISYKWLRGESTAVLGINATYIPVAANKGYALKVQVSRANNTGTIESELTTPVGSPLIRGKVTITGEPIVGKTLSIASSPDTEIFGSGTISYQWIRGESTNISTINAGTYTLVAADAGQTIRVRATTTGSSGYVDSNILDIEIPALTGTVTISGTPEVGRSLSAVTTSLSGSGVLSYKWLGDGTEISGETASTYTLQAADLGKKFTVRVSRAGFDGYIDSDPTSSVVAAAVLPENLSLAEALPWLSEHAVSGGSYTITLTGNETLTATGNLNYSGKTISVTIQGDDSQRTVNNSSVSAIFSVGETTTLTLGDNIKLQGKVSNNSVLVLVAGKLVMDGNSVITDNTNTSELAVVRGGAVKVDEGGKLEMKGTSSISGNKALQGGGVFVDKGGAFEMKENSTVSGNSSTSTDGGGVYVNEASFSMADNAKVSGNTSAANGGGVLVKGTLTMGGHSEISGNTANSTTSGGGGIFIGVAGSKIIMNNSSKITGNTAIANGGGVALNYAGTGTGPSLTMNGDSVISYNTSKGGSGGGGVFVYGDAGMNMHNNARVSGNTAANMGGGVFVAKNFLKDGGIIYGNNAPAENDSDGHPYENTASGGDLWGQAIYFYNSGTTKIRNTTVAADKDLSSTTPDNANWTD